MPEWMIPALQQTPWGVVIIVLFWLARGYQESRDKLFAASLKDVSGALAANTIVLGEMRGVLSRINGQAKR
jgi:hypothetical protein